MPLAAAVVPEPGPRLKHELFASVVEINDACLRRRRRGARRAPAPAGGGGGPGGRARARRSSPPARTRPPRERSSRSTTSRSTARSRTSSGRRCSGSSSAACTSTSPCPTRSRACARSKASCRRCPTSSRCRRTRPSSTAQDSGLRSSRADALAALPKRRRAAGVPNLGRLGGAQRHGVDYRRLHWDVRPHPDYGTLEVRIADQQTDVRRSAALAGDDPAAGAPRLPTQRQSRTTASSTRNAGRKPPSHRPNVALLGSRPEAERQLEIGSAGRRPGPRGPLASMAAVTTETLQVSGIRCERCVHPPRRAARGHDGLEAANANLMGQVTLSWDEEQTSREALLEAMAQGGFHVLATARRRNSPASGLVQACVTGTLLGWRRHERDDGNRARGESRRRHATASASRRRRSSSADQVYRVARRLVVDRARRRRTSSRRPTRARSAAGARTRPARTCARGCCGSSPT